MNEQGERMQLLIESCDFEQLNAAERELVLAHLSEDEYRQQRLVLLGSEALFAAEGHTLSPDPAILSNLQRAMKKEQETVLPAYLLALFQFRMPAYQAGIAMAVIAFLFWWRSPEVQFIETERIVYQQQVDTVRLVEEVLVEVPVTVERVKYIERQSPSPKFDQPTVRPEFAGGITPENETVQLDDVERSFGNSSLPEGALQQFLVGL